MKRLLRWAHARGFEPVRHRGSSMVPSLREGDLLFVGQAPLRAGAIVRYRASSEGAARVHRVVSVDETSGTAILQADAGGPAERVPLASIDGVVRARSRRGRTKRFGGPLERRLAEATAALATRGVGVRRARSVLGRPFLRLLDRRGFARVWGGLLRPLGRVTIASFAALPDSSGPTVAFRAVWRRRTVGRCELRCEASYTQPGAASATLAGLWVSAWRRRQGLASRLVRAAEGTAIASGARELRIEFAAADPVAAALCRHLGYASAPELPAGIARKRLAAHDSAA